MAEQSTIAAVGVSVQHGLSSTRSQVSNPSPFPHKKKNAKKKGATYRLDHFLLIASWAFSTQDSEISAETSYIDLN
ncbi:unnamed protein product [Periconia digitata]|uniref:Uncharacterized protein n=1 Tax=Periconia digitata TaxID=1303443 RepID=A0A9W4UVP6_9PLEO|nr:unnamed protein product [Periconia digitata]